MYFNENILNRITHAIENNELLQCISGVGDYLMMSRDHNTFFMHDLDAMLDYFNEYNKRYPEKELKEKYESSLNEMLESENSFMNIYAVKCIMKQLEKEYEEDFTFKLSDEVAFLEKAKQSIEKNKEGIIEVFGTSMNDLASERFYEAIKAEVLSMSENKAKGNQ